MRIKTATLAAALILAAPASPLLAQPGSQPQAEAQTQPQPQPQPGTEAEPNPAPSSQTDTQANGPVLILRSTGPSARRYRAGTRLPSSTTLNLRPGDTVVVMGGGSEGTRTFRGPGTFAVNGPARARSFAIMPRRQTGAVRSTEPAPPAEPAPGTAPSGGSVQAPNGSFYTCPGDPRCPKG